MGFEVGQNLKGARGRGRAAMVWDEAKFKAFADDIDRLRRDLEESLGEDDIRYAKRIRKVSRQMEVLGRFLLFISLDPMTWFVGVTALWIHRQLEITEIGHYALHGVWDRFPELSHLHAKNFNWICPAEEESWKHGHNSLHHQYTNIVGKDPDVNYGALRTSEHTPWGLYHAIQVAHFFMTAPFFMEIIGFYNTGLTDLFRKPKMPGYVDVLPDRKLKTIGKAMYQSLKKIVPFYAYQFVFWPALAGPMWLKVFLGNVLAHVFANIYTAASVYSGHFGEDTEFYPPDFKTKGRGEYYKAQVRAAHNFTSPLLMQILSGTLSAQIEHHLFPKMPPNRLRQVRSKVKEICGRHGVEYGESTWWRTWSQAIRYLGKMSFPSSKASC